MNELRHADAFFRIGLPLMFASLTIVTVICVAWNSQPFINGLNGSLF